MTHEEAMRYRLTPDFMMRPYRQPTAAEYKLSLQILRDFHAGRGHEWRRRDLTDMEHEVLVSLYRAGLLEQSQRTLDHRITKLGEVYLLQRTGSSGRDPKKRVRRLKPRARRGPATLEWVRGARRPRSSQPQAAGRRRMRRDPRSREHPIPSFTKWQTFAGGTGAAPGKNAYQLLVDIGDYHVDPVAPRGRHAGYVVSFANTRGRLPGGLWSWISRSGHGHGSPQHAMTLPDALRAVRAHYAYAHGVVPA